MSLSFSASVLQNINLKNYEKNFKIIFKNNSYACPDFIAELLSPYISKQRKTDSTVTSYRVDLTVKDKNVFSKLEDLVAGGEVKFEIEDVETELCAILLALGNTEIFDTKPFKIITNENAIPLIRMKKFYGAQYNEEIDYCAAHFEELKDQLLKKSTLKEGEKYQILPKVLGDESKKYVGTTNEVTLECSDILKIVLSERLVLSAEHSLLEFAKAKMKTDPDAFILLKGIKPQYLSEEEIDEFIDIVDKLEVNQIGSLWKAIRERFKKGKPILNPERSGLITLKPKNIMKLDIWNGLFAYYKKQKVNLISAVNVIINSTIKDYDEIYINEGSFYRTGNVQNSSIIFNLIKNKFAICGYSLKANPSENKPKSWKVEGSNDQKSWVLIDEKTDETSLESSEAEKYFACKQADEFQFIKFTQTKENSSNNYIFSLNRIELFGAIGSELKSDFSYNGNYWDGVFNYYRSISSNYQSEYVTPYCNSTYSGNVTYLLEGNGDFSTSASNSYYFMFTLNKNRLIINGYTFRTDGSWNWFPRYWKLEGSNDNSNWTVLHQINGNGGFSGMNQENYFNFNNSKPYKYFKFTLTNTSNSGNWYFALRRVELFGIIV